MTEQKYYDHLKPKLPKQSFSDMVDQQLAIVQQQQQMRAAQDMQIMKARQKAMESQQKQLLGYDVSDMSELDKQTFGAKRDWLKGRIDSYYYGPQNYGQFVEDVNSLKTLHAELKNHADNVSTSMKNLEGWVTGTKDWTNNELELKDDMNTLNAKRQMWEMSGIDPTAVTVDENGDTYGFYTDINGVRLKDESGQDLYGLAVQAPSRGSQEYFSPTTAPYGNLLPGKFSKDFSAAATRLRKNPNMSYEEKVAQLQGWVTATAMQNQAVQATAMSVFNENYGSAAQAAIEADAATNPAAPIQVREYVDETMKFLLGNLEEVDNSDGSSNSASDAFPGSVRFDMESFAPSIPMVQAAAGPMPQPGMGEGITALTVPRTSAGRSTITVESSWNSDFFQGPRREMVGDSYKVAAVAMDANKNLFVMAETIIEEDKSNFTPEQLERLSRNPSIVITEKKVRRRREIPIIVEPTTININNKSMVNEEYLTILASIGRVSGVKDDRRAQIKKGLDVLDKWNDESAQTNAALFPTP